jgi:hypothetical protein
MEGGFDFQFLMPTILRHKSPQSRFVPHIGIPHEGVTATCAAAIYESIYDLAILGNAQNHSLWRVSLRIVDCTETRQRSLRILQVGLGNCP